MSNPTPAELAAHNLIAVTQMNGKPVRAWDSVHKNFPPTTVYATPVAPPAPSSTFTATLVGTNQVRVAWSGFSPVKLGRNGVDTSGTGPWDTGTLTGEPTTGTFTFNDLVQGDTYALTATKSDASTLTATVKIPSVTPPPPPPPPPNGAYPSGLTPPPVAAGYKRLIFEDFLTTNSPVLAGGYGPGAPGGTHGQFVPSHVVQDGDSLLRLQFYSDGPGADGGDINGGGGTQTDQSQFEFKPNTNVYVARRVDAHPDVVGILLMMPVGGHWPGEMDFCEKGKGWIHWTAGNQQQGFDMPAGTDESQWHIWGCEYHTDFIVYTLDGVEWARMANPTTDPTDVNGLLRPMFVSFQIQDGDPGYPSSPIPYANRVEQQVDWLCFDVPA